MYSRDTLIVISAIQIIYTKQKRFVLINSRQTVTINSISAIYYLARYVLASLPQVTYMQMHVCHIAVEASFVSWIKMIMRRLYTERLRWSLKYKFDGLLNGC